MDGLNIRQLQSLQSKDQAELLDTVDEIRRHGVSRYISLPQIIVCGDQSSGKSSVLEAISGVQFPVDDGLCTRFTTEVILRRAPEDLATVKLIPHEGESPEHIEELLNFHRTSINHAEIPALISEAKAIMGLTGSSTFSRDVLQLEISGPKLPHLTLVDLPGLIHHPNKEQTEEDVNIPRDLVRKYMSQPRSIVLAIVTAKNDTSNQIILRMAKEVDPEGARTMGIITKPDSLIKGSPNEKAFFALASNKETYFKLDWHVLRNGDYNERKDPTFNRDEAEKKFFFSSTWLNLPGHKRGVESLRKRLSVILYQQIQKELPELLREIDDQLTECKTILDRLGAPRDTPASQRAYLSTIATEFHRLVGDGTQGNYQDKFFKLDDSTFKNLSERTELKPRLRASVRKEEEVFSDEMKGFGHSYRIEPAYPTDPRYPIDLTNLFHTKTPKRITENEFLQKIRILMERSKGKELPGTFSPSLVSELFSYQSESWLNIAQDFVERVWSLAKQFLDDVLTHVADGSVRQAILGEIIDPAMDVRLEKLKEKVDELYFPYRGDYLATLNTQFTQELNKRKLAAEKSQQSQQQQARENSHFRSSKNEIEDAKTNACRDLLYLMESYYGVAMNVFVDNVASLAVERCLMLELKNLLPPLAVIEMDDEMLKTIASESEDARELRSRTNEKLKALQKSFDLCRKQFRKQGPARLSEVPIKKKNQNPISPTADIADQFGKLNFSAGGSSENTTFTSGPVPAFGHLSREKSGSNSSSTFSSSGKSSLFDSYRSDSTPSSATSWSTPKMPAKFDLDPEEGEL